MAPEPLKLSIFGDIDLSRALAFLKAINTSSLMASSFFMSFSVSTDEDCLSLSIAVLEIIESPVRNRLTSPSLLLLVLTL